MGEKQKKEKNHLNLQNELPVYPLFSFNVHPFLARWQVFCPSVLSSSLLSWTSTKSSSAAHPVWVPRDCLVCCLLPAPTPFCTAEVHTTITCEVGSAKAVHTHHGLHGALLGEVPPGRAGGAPMHPLPHPHPLEPASGSRGRAKGAVRCLSARVRDRGQHFL